MFQSPFEIKCSFRIDVRAYLDATLVMRRIGLDLDEDVLARTSVGVARVYMKYLKYLQYYTNCSTNAVKHVSLLVNTIFNSYSIVNICGNPPGFHPGYQDWIEAKNDQTTFLQ
ncbi:hypothetical protein TNCV_2288031 [Trichonephila clavipes]|nr:hypothetical protein TNCV_2288031 [Trichonephila clavipes]